MDRAKLYTLTYTISNNTLNVMDLDAYMESSEGFVFSGPKYSSHRVLPLSSHQIIANVYALKAGKLQLPKFKVTKKRVYGSRQSSALDVQKEAAPRDSYTSLEVNGAYYDVCGVPNSEIYVFVKSTV